MTAPFLLDANALIALAVTEHEHHDRVARWVSAVDAVAICPITEGALVRFLVRVGGGAGEAREFLTRLRSSAGCEFWADAISYADVDLAHVQGHRQVTDAYLAGLAQGRAARLATLDQALAATLPDKTLLIP
ncbi:MAG: PIN domain-containing protein [Propionibacteriales bacterium]|nr:PIN domain-containing protein [Propionibacteriales bacterium]